MWQKPWVCITKETKTSTLNPSGHSKNSGLEPNRGEFFELEHISRANFLGEEMPMGRGVARKIRRFRPNFAIGGLALVETMGLEIP
jgi:hypothetical protein